ncbi:Y-family DNA polymerase [Aeromonas schubertii]|uniref:Y-family DNA polymerase n=1 Tax=Aeromonas schubertii TaxID=652 RepID=UPI0010A80A0A|nr:Y-family DNA polymerase [Aeromonas schubertii]QCG48246.1 Y-family DNA polymerase [Aeromonas schubertii]
MNAYALVDVNNFYASCERLFRPDLNGRPLVVLSNNDGCVVSRSPEAKALGVRMAVPFFQIRKEFEAQGGVWFSSNYALYGDLSQRVMSLLEQHSPRVEIYSIDEAFLELGERWAGDLEAYGRQLRDRVRQWTGLTVGVGIAPTKTLAKLANYAAKRWPATGGVVDLRDAARRHRLMAITPVGEVWGIGRRLSTRLQAEGIETIAQLLAHRPAYWRSRYGVVLERTVQELCGLPCLELEPPEPRQQVLCSRSFGHPIDTQERLNQALATFIERAAEKLRQQSLCTGHLTLFVRANPFRAPKSPALHLSLPLATPSDDTGHLLTLVRPHLDTLWQPSLKYQKGGVMLTDLRPRGQCQSDLFCPSPDPRRQALMQTVDRIRARGLGQLHYAAQGLREPEWMMRQEHKSPDYTHSLADLPRVRA